MRSNNKPRDDYYVSSKFVLYILNHDGLLFQRIVRRNLQNQNIEQEMDDEGFENDINANNVAQGRNVFFTPQQWGPKYPISDFSEWPLLFK